MLKRKETECDVEARRLALSLSRVAWHDLALRNVDLRALVTVDVSSGCEIGEIADWVFNLTVTTPEVPPQTGYVRLAPRELGWLVSLRHDPERLGAEIYREFLAGGASWE
jgi:hypothetical protein